MNFNKYMQPGSYHLDKIIKGPLTLPTNGLPPESEGTATLTSITIDGDSTWYHVLYDFLLPFLLLNVIFSDSPRLDGSIVFVAVEQ